MTAAHNSPACLLTFVTPALPLNCSLGSLCLIAGKAGWKNNGTSQIRNGEDDSGCHGFFISKPSTRPSGNVLYCHAGLDPASSEPLKMLDARFHGNNTEGNLA